jgi:hypothetical protein
MVLRVHPLARMPQDHDAPEPLIAELIGRWVMIGLLRPKPDRRASDDRRALGLGGRRLEDPQRAVTVPPKGLD